jgi:hypothetical protein
MVHHDMEMIDTLMAVLTDKGNVCERAHDRNKGTVVWHQHFAVGGKDAPETGQRLKRGSSVRRNVDVKGNGECSVVQIAVEGDTRDMQSHLSINSNLESLKTLLGIASKGDDLS